MVIMDSEELFIHKECCLQKNDGTGRSQQILHVCPYMMTLNRRRCEDKRKFIKKIVSGGGISKMPSVNMIKVIA